MSETSVDVRTERGGRRRMRVAWTLVATAMIAQATVSVAEMGVPTIAPFLKRSLGLSLGEVGLLVASINVGRIFGSFPAGRISDRVGEPPVMASACLGVAVFLSLASLAPGPLSIAVALAAVGVFCGSAAPAGGRYVLSAFAPKRRGLPMGLRQSSVPLGGLLAAAILPAVADPHGFRAAFRVAAAVALGGGLVVLATAKRPVRRDVDKPMSHRRKDALILRDRNLLLAISWAVLFIGGQYALLSYLVLDLTNTVRLTLASASLMLVFAQLGGIGGRIAWGYVSDRAFRSRRKPPLFILNGIALATALALALASAHEPLILLAVTAFLAGVSMVGWQGIWMSLVSELAPAESMGTVLGYGLTFTNVAVMIWPPLFGYIAQLSGHFAVSWLVLAVALMVSMVIALLVEERPLSHAWVRG